MDNFLASSGAPASRSIARAARAARSLASTLVVGLVLACASLLALRVYDIAAYAYQHPARPGHVLSGTVPAPPAGSVSNR